MSYNREHKQQVDEWNKKYPKDTPVKYYINGDPDIYETILTKSKAFLTYLPYPVIALYGKVKLVNLNHVKPVEAIE